VPGFPSIATMLNPSDSDGVCTATNCATALQPAVADSPSRVRQIPLCCMIATPERRHRPAAVRKLTLWLWRDGEGLSGTHYAAIGTHSAGAAKRGLDTIRDDDEIKAVAEYLRNLQANLL
jgi:hypothetical protein